MPRVSLPHYDGAMERWPVRVARLWQDGMDTWLANAHPHWEVLTRLSPYWLHTKLGFYPGDQFYRSR